MDNFFIVEVLVVLAHRGLNTSDKNASQVLGLLEIWV